MMRESETLALSFEKIACESAKVVSCKETHNQKNTWKNASLTSIPCAITINSEVVGMLVPLGVLPAQESNRTKVRGAE